MEVVVLMFTGSSFHNLGVATAKLWHPNLRLVFGMISKFPVPDVSERDGIPEKLHYSRGWHEQTIYCCKLHVPGLFAHT